MKLKQSIYFNILLGFLLLLPLATIAQVEMSQSRSAEELDSLVQRLSYYNEIQESDTAKVDLYIELATSFYRRDASRSFRYINEALSLAEQIDYTFGIAKAQQILGYLYIHSGEFTKAIELTQSSLAVLDSLDRPIEVNNSLSNLALAYLSKEEYGRAIEYYLDALPLFYAEGDAFNLNRAHFNMAKIYRNLDQDSIAIEYYKKVLNVIEENQYGPISNALAHNNLSVMYLRNGELQTAKEYIEKAIELRRQIGDNVGLAESQIVLGNIYLEEKDHDKALELFRTAVNQMDEGTRDGAQVDAYYGISTVFFHKGEIDSARYYGDRAVQFAVESETFEYPIKVYDLLARIYEAQQNFRQANTYRRQYSLLQDSLYSKKQAQQLAVMTSSFEIEDRELRIDLLEKENQLAQAQLEREGMIRYSLIVGTVLLLIILVLIGYGYQIRKKTTNKLERKNEQLEQLNDEKNMFMRMAAHDLKNPLSSILGLAELIKMSEPSSHDETLKYADNILLVSFRMNEIIKNLLNVEAIESGEQIIRPKPIDLHPSIKKVVDQYRKRAQEKHIQLHCEEFGGDLRVLADESAVDGILENLVSNAIKYSPKDKNVWVKAYSKNGAATIEVKDEGPGLTDDDKQNLFKKFKTLSAKPTGGEHSNGLGLYIVKNMIDRMNGSIECRSEIGHGTTFLVNLPKA